MISMPMYFPSSPFSLDDAKDCAQLVDIAYEMYAQWAVKKPKKGEFKFIPPAGSPYRFSTAIWGNSKVLIESDWEPFAFVAQKGSSAYLAIRGTQSSFDWIKDIEYKQEDYVLPGISGIGKVHSGFFSVYKTMRDDVLKKLNALKGIKRLYITGHSMGASLAMTSVADCLAHAYPNQSVEILQYNLAGPRTVNPELASYLNASNTHSYRIVNSADFVPELPTSISTDVIDEYYYQHVGTPVTYSVQYKSIGGNHSLRYSYCYALEHPEQPRGPGMPKS